MITTAQAILNHNRPSKGDDTQVLRDLAVGACICQTSDFELGISEYDFPDRSVLILRWDKPAMIFESR